MYVSTNEKAASLHLHRYITGCSDCVVVVGAVTRALRVEQCERLTCIAGREGCVSP